MEKLKQVQKNVAAEAVVPGKIKKQECWKGTVCKRYAFVLKKIVISLFEVCKEINIFGAWGRGGIRSFLPKSLISFLLDLKSKPVLLLVCETL